MTKVVSAVTIPTDQPLSVYGSVFHVRNCMVRYVVGRFSPVS